MNIEKIEMNLEIHFHQQDEGSIFLESNATGRDELFGELLLFCTSTMRHIVNFEHDNIADSIAFTLSQVAADMSVIENIGEVKLVTYQGTPGRKIFLASLIFSENAFNFYHKAKGFGLFSRGMGYYSPNSIVLLLKYLINKRINHQEYLNTLSAIMEECSTVYINGELTIASQRDIVLKTIMKHAIAYLI